VQFASSSATVPTCSAPSTVTPTPGGDSLIHAPQRLGLHGAGRSEWIEGATSVAASSSGVPAYEWSKQEKASARLRFMGEAGDRVISRRRNVSLRPKACVNEYDNRGHYA
jgi:hypothetical protein